MDEDQAQAEVEAFWRTARSQARLTGVPGYFGPTTLEVVQPPAWSFGTDAEADQELAALLDGSATTTRTALAELDAAGEPWPEVGMLGIVLDGSGHPRALVATTEVSVLDGQVVEQLTVLHRA